MYFLLKITNFFIFHKWVKTIIKPHKGVFNISVALLSLFQYNVKFEVNLKLINFIFISQPENWKKIQTFFISPAPLITQINAYDSLIKSQGITEGEIYLILIKIHIFFLNY